MVERDDTTRRLHRRTLPGPRRWAALLSALGVSSEGAAAAGTASAAAGGGGAAAGGLSAAAPAATAGGGVATGLGANMTAAPAAGSFMASPGMMYGPGASGVAAPSMWDVVNHMVQNYAGQGPVGQVAPDFARAHPYYAGAANAAMAPGGNAGRPPQAAPPAPAMGRDPRQMMQQLMGGGAPMIHPMGAFPSILQRAVQSMVPGY